MPEKLLIGIADRELMQRNEDDDAMMSRTKQ
jgi:hypothetical protein